MTFELKARSFPNRHSLFQLVDDPLTCPEAFAPMRTCHSQKKRWFFNSDKTNPVMNDNEPKAESICSLFDNYLQLMLGHFVVRFVINSFNLAAILGWSDYAPEINNRANAGDVVHPRCQRRRCHRNFTNDVCHVLKVLATVTLSASSSHKRRYQNRHESM